MAETRQVKLTLNPGLSEIVIDGTDIANAVQSFVVRGEVGMVPQLQLELELLLPLIGVHGEAKVTVYIPDATRDALVEVGWTPPAEPGVST